MNTSYAILAQAAGGAPAASGGLFGGLGGMGGMVPFILIFAIFYFMMIRPQQRKEKERRKTIEALRAGQRVLFAGGLIGDIVEAKPSTFLIEIAKGVHIEVARGAVSRLLKEGETVGPDDARA